MADPGMPSVGFPPLPRILVTSVYTSRSQAFHNPASLKRQREAEGHPTVKVFAGVDPRLRFRLILERLWYRGATKSPVSRCDTRGGFDA